jgi:DNA-binding NtrC family response regulator
MSMDAPVKTETVVESDRITVQQFRLTVEAGPERGRTWVSSGGSAIVGAAEDTDLVLEDAAVSRYHCEIAIRDGHVRVRDLGSRNGTNVDGVVVLEALLRDGALLVIGRSSLRFQLGSERVAVPLHDGDAFGPLAGRAPAMRVAFHALAKAAASDATLLLRGETGTGKELAAEAVHGASARAKAPMIVIDCGALPQHLLESELFGHEKGAFSDAHARRTGAFEAANGGTVFLDEIGELPLELQPKLLRAIERREIRRLGASHMFPVDVRIVAATNRDLRAEVNAGRFRADLFFRLAVLEVVLPPLRERREDIPLLVERIVEDLGAEGRPAAARFSTRPFLEALAAHAWPGNVRELRNYLHRCIALEEAAPLGSAPAPPASPGPAASAPAPEVDVRLRLSEARAVWQKELDRRYLEEVLRVNDGNITRAARQAGLDRVHLYRLLWKHGLK